MFSRALNCLCCIACVSIGLASARAGAQGADRKALFGELHVHTRVRVHRASLWDDGFAYGRHSGQSAQGIRRQVRCRDDVHRRRPRRGGSVRKL